MKDRTIKFRLAEELYNTLLVKAKAVNLNNSDYIRQSIINSDIKVDNSKNISKLIGSVNSVGNNLNQIALNLNIANNKDKLDDINYNNILDKLIIIEHQLQTALKVV